MNSDVLCVYASKFSGHQQAARAVRRALEMLSPDLKILELDFFTKEYPILGPAIASLYLGIVQKAPDFWNYLYRDHGVEETSRELRRFFNLVQLPKIRTYLKKYRPRVIISTHAATSGILAGEKENGTSPYFFLAVVVTDFSANNFQPLKGVDVFFVPTAGVKSELVEKGVPSKNIEVTGIPVHPDFSLDDFSEKVYREYSLKKNIFTILIMGGSRGLGGFEKIIDVIAASGNHVQTIVVCGNNGILHKNLTKKYSCHPLVKIIGYTDGVRHLMDVSDVIITKAGGITIAEAIHKNLPIIIFNPLPAQEEKNTKFLVDNDAAIYCTTTEELSDNIKKISTQPSRLLPYKNRMKNIMPTGASAKIAAYILERLNGYARR